MALPGNLWHLPQDPELWLILLYVTGVLIAARIVEVVAKAHFDQARRVAEHGFEYVAPRDHYQCLGGATLQLESQHDKERLAIYRAPVEHCGGCRLKAQCAPLEDSRRIYRSLATWAETDIGRFHQYFSVVMFAAALAVSAAAIGNWLGEPGVGYLALALGGCLACLAFHARRMAAGRARPGVLAAGGLPATIDDSSPRSPP